MIRYWVRFRKSDSSKLPIGLNMGCGVTAIDKKQAFDIIQEKIFKGRSIPEIEEIISDVEVSGLDSNHILPNIGNVFARGIWYPMGY